MMVFFRTRLGDNFNLAKNFLKPESPALTSQRRSKFSCSTKPENFTILSDITCKILAVLKTGAAQARKNQSNKLLTS